MRAIFILTEIFGHMRIDTGEVSKLTNRPSTEIVLQGTKHLDKAGFDQIIE